MHVMFRDFAMRDIPKEGQGRIAVVRERDCESFYVSKRGRYYIVENRCLLITPRTATTTERSQKDHTTTGLKSGYACLYKTGDTR